MESNALSLQKIRPFLMAFAEAAIQTVVGVVTTRMAIVGFRCERFATLMLGDRSLQSA